MTNDAKVDLLPCPFCGGKAQAYGNDKWDEDRRYDRPNISCTSCWMSTPSFNKTTDCALIWNRRSTENPSLPHVGEAERLVHTFMEGAKYVTSQKGHAPHQTLAKVFAQAVYWKDRVMEHGLQVLKWNCTCDWANGKLNPECQAHKEGNSFLAEVEKEKQ